MPAAIAVAGLLRAPALALYQQALRHGGGASIEAGPVEVVPDPHVPGTPQLPGPVHLPGEPKPPGKPEPD